ncbi:MAG: CHAD domain-containing protein [Planctomycetes bacterium]|nr:CHAD domain-containing protein [Planctomycetota bacterium]
MKTLEAAPPTPTLAGSFSKTASQHLERLREGEKQVRESGDLEGVHLMRTSCRRLRATVKYLGDHLARADRKSLQGGLRSLMAALGPVRDLDVLRHAIQGTPGLDPKEAELLAMSVDSLVAPATLRMNEALGGGDYARLLRDLARVAESSARSMPASLAGPSRIGKALAEAVRLKPANWAAAPDEELHDLRKGIKKLRYALEAFAPSYGRPVSRAIERCRELQESLGTLQDAAVFGSLLKGVRTFGSGQFLATVRARADAGIQALPAHWERAFGPKGLSRLGGHLFRRAV